MVFAIPDNLDALLTREATSVALKLAGFPVETKTLATKASRGGGPPYRLFGRKPLYRWGDALAWAQARLSPPIRSSSELDLLTSGNRAEVDDIASRCQAAAQGKSPQLRLADPLRDGAIPRGGVGEVKRGSRGRCRPKRMQTGGGEPAKARRREGVT